MNEVLTPVEVLDIAQQIERNGVAFYEKAIELFDKPTPRVIFRTLAQRELEHEKIFGEMKQTLVERGVAEADDTPEGGPLSSRSMAVQYAFPFSRCASRLTPSLAWSSVLTLV